MKRSSSKVKRRILQPVSAIQPTTKAVSNALAHAVSQTNPGAEAVQITKDESSQVLLLAGKLTIRTAEELHQALCHFVIEEEKSMIDVSQVEECDTAALQLLYSARKTVESSGRRFALSGLPAALRDTCALLGLALVNSEERGGSANASELN